MSSPQKSGNESINKAGSTGGVGGANIKLDGDHPNAMDNLFTSSSNSQINKRSSSDGPDEVFRKIKSEEGYSTRGPHAQYNYEDPDFERMHHLLSSGAGHNLHEKEDEEYLHHHTTLRAGPGNDGQNILAYSEEMLHSAPKRAFDVGMEAIEKTNSLTMEELLAWRKEAIEIDADEDSSQHSTISADKTYHSGLHPFEEAVAKTRSSSFEDAVADGDADLVGESDIAGGNISTSGSSNNNGGGNSSKGTRKGAASKKGVDKLSAKEKNREHAKNTRIRKKNYVESLKDSIRSLSEEKEKTERDRKVSLSRLLEQTTVRKRVLQDFMTLRGQCVLDRAQWSTILEESVEFVLPITPYRSFPPTQVMPFVLKMIPEDAFLLKRYYFCWYLGVGW